MPYPIIQASLPLIQPVTEPFLLPKNKGNVFEDSFGAEKEGTTLPHEWTSGSGGVYLVNGWLRSPDTSSVYWIAASKAKHRDVVVEAEYKLFATANRYFGIVLRNHNGNSNGYNLIARQGVYRITRIDSWTETVIASVDASVPQQGIIRAEATGPRLTLYVNDKKVVEVVDSTYLVEGWLGMYFRASAVNWIKAVRL